MTTKLWIALILMCIFILAVHFAITYGIYWLLVFFGAPKWVGVALAGTYFIVAGWITNSRLK